MRRALNSIHRSRPSGRFAMGPDGAGGGCQARMPAARAQASAPAAAGGADDDDAWSGSRVPSQALPLPPEDMFMLLESYCGQAPLAVAARNTGKFLVRGLDRDPENVWQATDHHGRRLSDGSKVRGVPICDGSCAGRCDELHSTELLEEDFKDMPLDHAQLDALIGNRRVHWAHFGFECTSFTRLQQESHRREHSNFFMGVSTLAYEANRNLMHLVAFMFLLRRRYPHVVFSLENPEATLANHPLIRHLVEQPVHEGGLGLLLTPVTYCYYDPAGPMKPSIFWNNSRQLLLEFVDISVTPWENRRRCGSDGCDCGDYGRHLQTRAGVRGNSSRQNTAMYPRKLCQHIVDHVLDDIRHGLRRDDRYTTLGVEGSFVGDDGSYGHCCSVLATDGVTWVACKQADPTDDTLLRCDGCPRTFHEACVPARSRWRQRLIRDGMDEGAPSLLCDLCASVGWQALMPWADVDLEDYVEWNH